MPRNTSKFFSLTKKKSIELQRVSSSGEYSDTTGLWVPAIKEAVTIEVNIQPFKPSQYLLLPESSRTKEWLNVYSEYELRSGSEGEGSREADKFIYQGKLYKIMDVKKWGMGVLDHFHAHAALDSPTPIGVDING